MKDIRHIATSFGGRMIALAEFEKRVQIFDIKSMQVISEFDTILDFGGQRLAISEDGKVCICGCWGKHGICAYETKTGNLLWQRKDLKRVQQIQILNVDNSKFFVQFEVGTSRILDINTGLDMEKVSGAKYILNSNYLEIDIVGKSSKIQILERETKKVKTIIETQIFEPLDVDIADNCFLVAASGGPLSCYDITSGQLKWRMPINDDGHFLRVAFNEELDSYFGVSWPFMTGGDKKLKRINKDSGKFLNEVIIGCPAETEFALNGSVLVTSDREVIDLKSGEKKSWA